MELTQLKAVKGVIAETAYSFSHQSPVK